MNRILLICCFLYPEANCLLLLQVWSGGIRRWTSNDVLDVTEGSIQEATICRIMRLHVRITLRGIKKERCERHTL